MRLRNEVSGNIAKENHINLQLGEILISESIISDEEFTNALNQYKEEFSLSDEQFDAIKKGDIDTLVDTVLEVGSSERAETIKDYLSLLAKNMIRFVEDQIRMEPVKNLDSCSADWLVYQNITGATPYFTAFLADEKVFLDIAAKYAQEELTEVDELAEASVGEFLNLHNGIFTVNMSNREIELDMLPQQVKAKGTLTGLENASVVKITLPTGAFYVVLSEKKPIID